jgi:hypothetical protein
MSAIFDPAGDIVARGDFLVDGATVAANGFVIDNTAPKPLVVLSRTANQGAVEGYYTGARLAVAFNGGESYPDYASSAVAYEEDGKEQSRQLTQDSQNPTATFSGQHRITALDVLSGIKDLSGNVATSATSYTYLLNEDTESPSPPSFPAAFDIDNTAPTVTLSLSGTEGNAPYYRRATLGAAITGETSWSFDAAAQGNTVRYALNGAPVSLPAFAYGAGSPAWTAGMALEPAAEVKCAYDGFSVAGIRDKAGNPAVLDPHGDVSATGDLLDAQGAADAANGFMVVTMVPKVTVKVADASGDAGGTAPYYKSARITVEVADAEGVLDPASSLSYRVDGKDAALGGLAWDPAASVWTASTAALSGDAVYDGFGIGGIASRSGVPASLASAGGGTVTRLATSFTDGALTSEAARAQAGFVLDNTAPEVTITRNGGSMDLLGLVLNGTFSAGSVSWYIANRGTAPAYALASSDAYGLKTAAVYRIEDPESNPQQWSEQSIGDFLLGDATRVNAALPASGGVATEYTATDSPKGDGRYVYAVHAVDWADNSAWLISDGGSLIDATKPTVTPKLTPDTSSPRGEFYTKDFTFTANVIDPKVDVKAANGYGYQTASLIKSVRAYINVPGQGEEELVPTGGGSYEKGLDAGIGLTWAAIVKGSYEGGDFGFAVDAASHNANGVTVRVVATDNVGNATTTTTRPFSIDTEAPTVTVELDQNERAYEIAGKAYFQTPRTAIVTVSDRNLDLDPEWAVVDTEGVQGDWTEDTAQARRDGFRSYSKQVVYGEDADYTLSVKVADDAGHVTADRGTAGGATGTVDYSGTAAQAFTVDLTDPVISLSFDNDDMRSVEDVEYFKAARICTVTVREHNFLPGQGAADNASGQANVFDWESTNGTNGTWTTDPDDPDSHSITVSFPTDNEYVLHFAYTDASGRAADQALDESFTVDLTNPELAVSGVEDAHAYGIESLPVALALTDTNDGTIEYTITKASLKGDGGTVASDQREVTSGSVVAVEYHNENTGRADDGIYTLQTKATDKAGNETTVDMIYSVNRWGSTWYAGDSTNDLLAAYYTNDAPKLEIHEVNPTAVALSDISIVHSGSGTKVLEEGDWRVDEQTAGDGWHEYVYTIPSEHFVADGAFVVNFLSEDEVGNRSGNTAVKDDEAYESDSSLAVEFMLDATLPSVVITGVEQDGRYSEDVRTARVDISDVTLKGAKLYLNGAATPVATWTADEVNGNGGYVDYVVQAADVRQSISVVVDDLAGNSFETTVSGLLITTNGWVQFVNNTPLLVGSIVGVVVVIGGGMVLLYLLLSGTLAAGTAAAADAGAASASGDRRMRRGKR